MIGAYVRVSSKTQDLATQRDAIKRAAKARGLRVEVWYCDRIPGAGVARPDLDRCKKDAREGKLSLLFVFRLDRLSRGGIAQTLTLVNDLSHCGCKVESIADGFSLAGPHGEIVLAVLAWAAEMERAAIKERTAAARQRVEASGGSWGRPKRVDAKLGARIREMKGRSVRSIAMAVKVPKSTVACVLSEKGGYKRKVSKAGKSPGKVLARPASR